MIIITGASKGIGKYLFDQFSSENIEVIGTYNSTFISQKGYFKVNTTNYDQVCNWIESVQQDLKNITLINCAGISYNSFTHKSDHLKWKEVIEVNLIGTYNCIRTILPIMRSQKFGRIINISSVVAIKGIQGTSAYAASKSALWGLSKCLAQENGALNITINNINMGYSEIGMIEQVPESFVESIKKQIPSGNLCKKEEILKTIKYLIENEYTNGISIDLSGGLI
jgi:NAD(P)-dependent dehydrogenase (short-subunit alcohol dehydrogenase family)